MRTPLLAWLDAPSTTHGIHFSLGGQGDDAWAFWSYDQLARLAHRFAAAFHERGVRPGEVVTMILRSSPEFVAALFGAMAAGATPSPIAPPVAFQHPPTYDDHVVGLLRVARPALVIVDPAVVGRGRSLASLAGLTPECVVAVDELVVGSADDTTSPAPARLEASDLALLQFTSGSSGRACGVRVPVSALESNVEAIRTWLQMTPSDPTATWLPVHHDMGLIGCLVTPVVNGSDIWVMSPEEFVRQPGRYLRCFGASGARLTAMPNFGLAYIAKRVKPEALDGLDFSEWRAVIVGAERLDTAAFASFLALLAPRGLRRGALLPAYGLAEATLAVTGLALEEEWRALCVDRRSLVLGQAVADPPIGAARDHATSIVGCGKPLHGLEIAIVDADRRPLPERHVGEVVVRGASVAAGYALDAAAFEERSTEFTAGAVWSGDVGFVSEGELFVLGRRGDALKIRGRTLFAEDVEAAVTDAGVPANRSAALLGVVEDVPTVVLVIERAESEWLRTAERVLGRVGEGARVMVIDAPRGSILRTSSGKPRRRPLWRAFLESRLSASRIEETTHNHAVFAAGGLA